MRDGPVPDDAAVDEDVLRPARRTLVGQRRDEAGERGAARLAAHRRPDPADRRRSGYSRSGERRDRRALQQLAPGAGQREADLRIAQRQLRDDPRHLRGLGGVGLQELPPRRQVVEQVRRPRPSVPSGAPASRDGLDLAAVDPDLGAGHGVRGRACAGVKCDTEAMLGSASPRNPRVAMAARSSAVRDLAGGVALEAQPRVLRAPSRCRRPRPGSAACRRTRR